MRRLTQALLALAGVIIGTGVASAAPVLHLSGWKATAGKPETFTITRIGGNGGTTAVFSTGAPGDVAQPGVDYAATNVTIAWQPRQTTATVQVPTFVDIAHAGSNVQFTGTVSWNGQKSSAQGLIVEPAAPVIPATQTCADGSVILATATCPAPVPVAQWVAAPFTNGGYARCKNSAGCRSDSAPCPQGLTPPAVCSQPDVIAKFGEVWLYAWNGWSSSVTNRSTGAITDPGHAIGAFWPIGEYKFAGVGVEGPVSDWEGVAPAP